MLLVIGNIFAMDNNNVVLAVRRYTRQKLGMSLIKDVKHVKRELENLIAQVADDVSSSPNTVPTQTVQE